MTDHDVWMTTADGLTGLHRYVGDGTASMDRLQIAVGTDAALSIEATDEGELEVTRV